MAVGIVGPDRDHGEGRVRGGVQGRLEVGAAVMGHFQHVDPQPRVLGEQVLLLLLRGVAQEEHRAATNFHADHERGVVGVRLTAGLRRSRSKNLHARRTNVEHSSGRRGEGRDAPWIQGTVDDAVAEGRLLQRAGQHVAHLSTGHHPGRATHMVEVEVGQHEQGYRGDTERT